MNADRPDVLPAALERAVAGPDAPFLLCDDRDWSYHEFASAVDRFASGLMEAGIGRGDRVAIAAPNSAEWLITWFAVTKIGAVLVTLNVAYREREFSYMLNQSGATMLVCAAESGGFDFVGFLDALRPRIPDVAQFVFVGGEGFAGSRRWEELAEQAPAAELASARAAVRPADPAVILYTSGTTGDPKGAVLTHSSILASGAAQADHLDQRPSDVAIGHMPLNHVGGMTCTVTASLLSGGAVALLARYAPALAVSTIDRHKVTIFIGVPTMYKLSMDTPEFVAADVSSVRTCVIGGSNMEPAMGTRVLEAFPGARLANLYGMSETSGGCIISGSGDDLQTLVQTLGVPIGDFAVRIADDDHREVPVGEEGELLVRGGCVAAAYWEKPAETAGAFLPDGWLATGDMARLRPDGRVELCGRKKEMYVRSGYNVYPVEIENVLATDPAVAMGAVIGVPDDVYGEVGHAYVVAAAGHEVDVDRLLATCAERLASYKVPAEVHVVDSLPLTPSGKIKKVALQQLARDASGS